MTLHDPARRPCGNPARPCGDPARTLQATLPGSAAGGLACANPAIQGLNPAATLSTLRARR